MLAHHPPPQLSDNKRAVLTAVEYLTDFLISSVAWYLQIPYPNRIIARAAPEMASSIKDSPPLNLDDFRLKYTIYP